MFERKLQIGAQSCARKGRGLRHRLAARHTSLRPARQWQPVKTPRQACAILDVKKPDHPMLLRVNRACGNMKRLAHNTHRNITFMPPKLHLYWHCFNLCAV